MWSDKDRSNVKDTPPTSDAIDVDMLSGEEEQNERVQVPRVRAFNSYMGLCNSWMIQTRVKRKLFIDSDDESPVKKAALAPSSPESPVISSAFLTHPPNHYLMSFIRTSKETTRRKCRDG